MSIDEIRKVVDNEMRDFEPYFKAQLKSPNALLSVITNYILRRKGKQMRPMLVFLSAKATGGTSEASYAAATLIELLHTATLVHDDVVDETYQRRGQFSVNAIWLTLSVPFTQEILPSVSFLPESPYVSTTALPSSFPVSVRV